MAGLIFNYIGIKVSYLSMNVFLYKYVYLAEFCRSWVLLKQTQVLLRNQGPTNPNLYLHQRLIWLIILIMSYISEIFRLQSTFLYLIFLFPLPRFFHFNAPFPLHIQVLSFLPISGNNWFRYSWGIYSQGI